MKKMILAIGSSPRVNGNTDFALKTAVEEAEKSAWVYAETIQLRDYDIHACAGCFSCCNEPAAGTDKACPVYHDGMYELYPKLKACDALLLATPVYFGSMNAQMKAFMDRTEGGTKC